MGGFDEYANVHGYAFHNPRHLHNFHRPVVTTVSRESGGGGRVGDISGQRPDTRVSSDTARSQSIGATISNGIDKCLTEIFAAGKFAGENKWPKPAPARFGRFFSRAHFAALAMAL